MESGMYAHAAVVSTNYNYPGPAKGESRPNSTGHLVALSDQLDAAVSEVAAAWQMLCFGPQPETPADGLQAWPSDRLERTANGIQTQIERLRILADQIRERSD